MRATKALALAALLAAGTALVAPRSADAAFTFTFLEQGGNVVGTGSGTINLDALTFLGVNSTTSAINPGAGVLAVLGNLDVYSGLSGPASFGSGGLSPASSKSGSAFGLDGPNTIYVPDGYASGTSFSTGLTFDNATFASLGLTPGTYVYTWGLVDRGTDDSFTLQIGPAAVPEPASMALLGAGLLGLGAAMRRRRAV